LSFDPHPSFAPKGNISKTFTQNSLPKIALSDEPSHIQIGQQKNTFIKQNPGFNIQTTISRSAINVVNALVGKHVTAVSIATTAGFILP